ncbi:hypothetical protein N7541_003105 [Penicillium brevicompactum]|uniref:Uncharacterized protein n=1 Tax=Penicillium brevicompactum TaxID=5074 RepID=A0A9W9V130_PENBR|nr:hypothetical protein N7541_003105 [Penicillium brevicompactum]
MIRPQLRQISLRCERVKLGLSTPARQFSYTRTVAEDQPRPSAPSGNGRHNPRPSSAAPNRRPHNPNGPPRPNPNYTRPHRVIDARSFAASKAGGGEQPKIIRSPRTRGGPPGGRPGVRPGGRPGGQSSGQPFKRNAKPFVKGKGKGKGKFPRRKRDSADGDQGEEDAMGKLIEQVQQQQIVDARPTPVRYEPQEVSLSSLRITWPRIPTDSNARSAAVYQELSRRGGRIAGGYLSTRELGRRLYEKRTTVFHSEAEKAEALKEAERVSQRYANMHSRRLGKLCEPKEISFLNHTPENRDLQKHVQPLVHGVYPHAGNTPSYDHRELSRAQERLRQNATFSLHQSQDFVRKLNDLVNPGKKLVTGQVAKESPKKIVQ